MRRLSILTSAAAVLLTPAAMSSQQFTKAAPITLSAPVIMDTTGMFQAAFAKVGEDIFIGGQPTEKALREMKAQGVTTVVNLRMPDEMSSRVPFDEAKLIADLGMKYVHIPVRAGTTNPYSIETLAKFTEAVKGSQGKVLLHCTIAWRASHLWAAYLIKERGVADEAAVKHAREINLMDEHRMTEGNQPVEDFLGRRVPFIKRPPQ